MTTEACLTLKRKGAGQMIVLETIKLIFEIVSAIAGFIFFAIKALNWFIDYKFNQKIDQLKANCLKENRCSSSKTQQR